MKAIYLFYLFKFAPKVIDTRTHIFWQNSVDLLNAERRKSKGKFYLWKIGRLYCREPYAYPMITHWTYSSFHPFCWLHNEKLTGRTNDDN